MGADFSVVVSRSYTPAHLATTMWNHAPVMWGAMDAAGIRRPKLSAGDAADLFAYFYSTRFFDKPGRPRPRQGRFHAEALPAIAMASINRTAKMRRRSQNGNRWPTRSSWCSRCGITAATCRTLSRAARSRGRSSLPPS